METIKSRSEFEEVFSRGRRHSSKLLRVTVLSDDEGGPGKVAFVAAKRLGNAVFRNRCKRVMREAARRCGMPRTGTRTIMFATTATHDANPDEVAEALERLMAKDEHRRSQG
ncbi:MAG: ribonuclease P protein component [Atopobiaceae bacterium]|nr:ribonuclease P protein component [Olsenella sp.]MBQ6492162.1 ribonuclease P protein component [Atopobiaceae bacterium]